ncbi:MAG TPA: MFS transporter, partial [Herpetosiphonaceae bacterium]|nr:MFS transporter [Herpetosiphonaceae bacterium]
MRWLSTRIGLPSSALWLLGGTFITTIGNGMQGFTIALLLYEHTGSAAAFGGVIIFEQVLTFVMQVLAGPWVDRGDPRRTCVQVDLLRGVVVCCASALFGTGHLVLWVMLVSLVIRVAHPFYRAATFALAPAVVSREALGRYNGFTNISLQAGQLTGIVLAGPVFYYLGGATAFFINGLTFLFSALAISRIRLPAAEPANQPAVGNAWNLVLTGWSEIAALLWRQAGFAWHLLLNTADAVAVHLFNLISVPLIAERYAGSAYWLSTIGVVYALGAMVAGAL